MSTRPNPPGTILFLLTCTLGLLVAACGGSDAEWHLPQGLADGERQPLIERLQRLEGKLGYRPVLPVALPGGTQWSANAVGTNEVPVEIAVAFTPITPDGYGLESPSFIRIELIQILDPNSTQVLNGLESEIRSIAGAKVHIHRTNKTLKDFLDFGPMETGRDTTSPGGGGEFVFMSWHQDDLAMYASFDWIVAEGADPNDVRQAKEELATQVVRSVIEQG